MFLTKIALTNWVNEYISTNDVHQLVNNLFPSAPTHIARADADSPQILYRIEDAGTVTPTVIVQSRINPDAAGQTKHFAIPTFGEFLFRIDAAPCLRNDGKARTITNPDEQLEWLTRKLSGACTIHEGAVVSSKFVVARRAGSEVRFPKARFEGVLSIDDGPLFQGIVAAGIGRHRAWGCGLLSLAPA